MKMSRNSTPISRQQLLNEANSVIQLHDDYIKDMTVTSVEDKGGVLVFGGEYFLDEQGLPTAKSTAAFNMFKYLTHLFSEKYHLID